jgi:beta-lactam-binding protein with PASTA domain
MSATLDGIRTRDFAFPPAVFFDQLPAPTSVATPTAATPSGVSSSVPDVVDQRLSRAQAEVSASGYNVATVQQCDPSGNAFPGDVWRQSPAAGTAAPQNSTVTLWYGGDGCN